MAIMETNVHIFLIFSRGWNPSIVNLCWKKSLVGSAEKVGIHGSFAFNLVQALEDAYRRVIIKGRATFSKLPFRIEVGFPLFSWFQILIGVRLYVPLVRGAEGQKTQFAVSWAMFFSNESPTLVFAYTGNCKDWKYCFSVTTFVFFFFR